MVEIEKYSFGRMVISGQEYREDLKIIQGRVVSGWWRRKGHRVTVQDVLDVFQAKPDILVVGRGRPGLMKVDPELAKALEKENIELVDKGTAKAVQEFNLLAGQGADVAGCFHLT
ncbi:MAG: MTH938/NDUFAF3 family protein, partial [Desulfonatronovibrionaceae bacterium]